MSKGERTVKIHDVRKTMLLGLGLSATLAVALAGCGGDAGNKDDAVIVKAPDAKTNTASSSTSVPAPTPATSGGAAPSTSTSTSSDGRPSRRKAGGPSRAPSSSAAPCRRPRSSSLRAKPRRIPEICAKTGPILVRASGHRLGHQGRQERLRLPPSSHGGQRRCQEGGRGEEGRLRPEGMRLHPPRPGRDGGRARRRQVERPHHP